MTYKEQLQDERWKEKRSQVLHRDNFTCQNCNNNKIYALANHGIIVEVKVIYSLFRMGNRYPLEHLVIISNGQNASFCITPEFSKETLSDVVGSTVYYFKSENRGDGQLTLSSENTVAVLIKNDTIFYARDLHVHHNYYQENKLAWEYDDNALITLCWSCHEELHKNQNIPIRNSIGDEIGNRKCCDRCMGAGFFPEYSHVQNGICFKCDGERFI